MLRTVALFIATTAAVVLVAAQQSSGPQKLGKSGPAQANKNATGNDIGDVIDRLLAAGSAKGKGEFETTEQYQSRSAALATRFGQLTFLLPEKTASLEYDADRQDMTLSVGAWRAFLNGLPLSDGPPETLILRTDRAPVGSRTGTNTATIAAFERGIVIDHSSKIVEALEKEDLDLAVSYRFAFGLTVDRARAIKPFLRALVVGTLADPRVYTGKRCSDCPAGQFVPLLVDEIRVIDIRTGVVLASSREKDR